MYNFFIGGCFVEGNWLRNAFRWKETIGPWEERPGHYGDVWNYWTDDGLGYYEFLLVNIGLCYLSLPFFFLASLVTTTDHISFWKHSQKLAEDLGALPVWVFNAGNCYYYFYIFALFILYLIINTINVNFVEFFSSILGISHNDGVNSSMVTPFVQVPFELR